MTQIGPLPGVEVHAALRYYPDDYDVARWGQAHWDVATWPSSAPSEDVSCLLRSYTSSVGRDQPLERFRTGTAQLVVADPDGLYSPWRTAATNPPPAAAIRPGIDVEVWAELGGPNLAANSSFENGWTGWVGPGQEPWATWEIADDAAYHGSHSARMTCLDPGFNGNPGHYGNAYQNPSVILPGYEGPWTGSAWFKAPPGRSVGVGLIKYYDDGTGQPVMPWTPGPPYYPPDATLGGSHYLHVLASGQWQRVVARFPADTSTARSYSMDFRVGIGGANTGWQAGDVLHVDAAQCEPGPLTEYAPKAGELAPFPRFTGRVHAIKDLFETTGYHEVQFDCADWSSLLAVYDGVEQAAAGAGETSGARIGRICDNAGYDKPRRFDAGVVTLQATTLAKNALDEIGLVCDTETGAVFCDPAGVLVHRDRNGITSDPLYTEIQATFGEVEPEVCYVAIELACDTDKVKNVVSIANEGGSAVTVEDTQSSALYGRHTYRRFDLIHENAAESPVTAQRHLAFYAYAANRVESLTPLVTPSTLLTLLPLGLLHRVKVIRRATGFNVAAELQIEGIQETITPDAWSIVYTTFSADAVFDVARWVTDLWDRGKWGY